MCFEKLIGVPFRMFWAKVRLYGTNSAFKVDRTLNAKLPKGCRAAEKNVRKHQLAVKQLLRRTVEGPPDI
jgi:hypothetical protein